MTDKEKIRKEIVRMHNLLPVMDDYNIYVNYADRICTTLEMYIDSLQEEPVSNDLEQAAVEAFKHIVDSDKNNFYEIFKAGAQWQKEHLWKPADGDDLPDIDREVIVLYQHYPLDVDEYSVGFAHRPPEYWDGKNIGTGVVTRYYPKKYGKGGWSSPDVKFWLDCGLPKMEGGEV